MYVGLSVLVCLILVMLADFIHNIKKTGEELGKVSEHIVMSTNGWLVYAVSDGLLSYHDPGSRMGLL